ncbi:ogr/Delta-like zinc finger family protein [Paraburkholderia fungorum]|uniref:ogr/Delta-like zinc finger family protein n=1 Tax=Paraburkholderia fungorum TaxID=134537 RepID=UPI00209713AB|nr:ogr/Delta-like zinc finger family protein [Paraburkholderia fungorum]USX10503.1 ogr/Delta-like zinc finger family protein [Paraburkholderia fungorum]
MQPEFDTTEGIPQSRLEANTVRMKIDCPCCSGDIDARHTESLSGTMRRIYFVCGGCGYRTPAALEILFSLSPSARPREGVCLEVRQSSMLCGSVNARTAMAQNSTA